MKNTITLIGIFLILLTSCSNNDDNGAYAKTPLKEIVTTSVENGESKLLGKARYAYNEKNQVVQYDFTMNGNGSSLGYIYNDKNQITKITATDYGDGKSIDIDFSYDMHPNIPVKMTISKANQTIDINIVHTNGTIKWLDYNNKSCSITDTDVETFTFTEYENNGKTSYYTFNKTVKNNIEFTNSNFSLVNFIFASHAYGNMDIFYMYGYEVIDTAITKIITATNQEIKFDYQLDNERIKSRKLSGSNGDSSYIMQNYSYY